MSRRYLVIALIGTVCLTAVGCHRQFYRRQADQEVNCLIKEKSRHVARGPNGRMTIDLDRRSRMFNPFDLDFQPIPLDDPASNRYMQCVDGRRAYPLWEAPGVTNTVESPDWWQFLPLNDDGVLVINADSAVQLALLHSPDYQRQLEQLYLSALDVSSERFLFDTQYFADTSDIFDLDGSSGDTFFTKSTGFTISRQFATGGQLLAGVANSIVWQVSGSDQHDSTTVLDFTLIQPLLRGAGRDRVMERLTLSERRLLANIRAFERYRRSFYLNITIGRGIESTVQRSGGVFGVGLEGFSGLGSGFAGVGGGGNAGFAGGGGGVPQAGGFLGLLQDKILIQNGQENIERLAENLLVLENTLIELLTTIPDDPEAIVRQRLQIAQSKNALLRSQRALVGQQAAYQTAIDNFLSDLGLPPYVCVKIEDPLLDQFELIDRDLQSRRAQLIDLRTEIGALNISLLGEGELTTDPQTGLPISKLTWTPQVEQIVRQMQAELQPLNEFLTRLQGDDASRVNADVEELVDAIPERVRKNDQLLELYRRERENICCLLGVNEIDDSVFNISELAGMKETLRGEFDAVIGNVSGYADELRKINVRIDQYLESGSGDMSPQEFAADMRDTVILAIQDLLSNLGDDVLKLQLVQARARTESVLLPDVDIDPGTAFRIASRNRRDWANARAAVVDAYRLIEFNADNLESSLDITFSGGLTTSDIRPGNLGRSFGDMRLGLGWDAPITRLQERNAYRQSLIEFERAKRSYYEFEDGIWRLLRGQLRQLQANQVSFEYNRQEVRIAASQITLNEDIRELRDSRGLNSGPTAARDTISALGDLLTAQNALLNIFVNYEVVRRGLNFDLGVMELTPDGLWMDPGEIDSDYLLSLPGTTAEGVPSGDCTNCGIRFRHQAQPPQYGDVIIHEPGLMEVDQVGYEEEK